MRFEYYVLNGDFNTRSVNMFNIFDNIHVQEHTEKAIKKYLRAPSKFKYEKLFTKEEPTYGFEALCKEIKSIIQWQEWSRCEYEIIVRDQWSDKEEKWDCYMQAAPNIEMIARECIYQYKKQLKEQKNETD